MYALLILTDGFALVDGPTDPVCENALLLDSEVRLASHQSPVVALTL